MELHELHVDQFGADVISKRMAVTGVFPTVAGDFVCPTGAARSQHDGFRFEKFEPPPLALVPECADDGGAIREQRDGGGLPAEPNARMEVVRVERVDSP